MRFHDPELLWLLLLLLPWLWLRHRRARGSPALVVADGAQLAALPDTPRARLRRHLPWLRLLILILGIVALARPQTVEQETKIRGKGVDLVIALDLSTSMLAEDARGAGSGGTNRLAMAKAVLDDFIRGRPGDRIGLVAFAARPYPAAPLTLDHAWLREAVAGLRTGAIEDGTALGDALLAALNRLRGKGGEERSASQAVILVTDGRGNAGATSPQLAAAAARTLGIRVHAIGIGSRGEAVIPVEDPLGGIAYRRVRADLDEAVLREIAATTGGAYFRADDGGGLARVFREIDRLEKRPIEQTVRFAYGELFPRLVLAMLVLLAAELTLRATLLRTLP
ncbi:MAG: VWA domain-containing protein [Thiobacillaceae bacterium]|jgi:Ca-activated chloride channel family protein|nr:VWA domain-containing protein [Thiobacillaceae bacterium]